jgi:hypothetical protein
MSGGSAENDQHALTDVQRMTVTFQAEYKIFFINIDIS